MRVVIVLFLNVLACQVVSAQVEWRPLGAPEENTILGAYRADRQGLPKLLSSAAGPGRYVMVGPTHSIFPQIAAGDSWETVFVIVNMSLRQTEFTQRFYGSDGRPMRMKFITYPGYQIVEDSGVFGRLNPGASFNFAVFRDVGPVQVGWASLDYDTRSSRLGAYAVFRQKIPGRPTFEALVPLSAYDDTIFFMPFDNLEGFDTGMALVNPASNIPNTVTLTFQSLRADILFQDRITLPPSGHTAFSIPSKYPSLQGKAGTVLVESNTTRLSAMGLRFNVGGGGAFSSIPIMNWSDMMY